ncbi:MAG: sigma 54-interacting transcriptional regulator [Sandaracinaceae bacterium]|nr:sigma 54-interacting transcriptional regulator [Sandaracinaceae bacterium]
MSIPPPNRATASSQPDAFIAVKLHERSWVVDLPVGASVVAGSGRSAQIRIDATDVGAHHAEIHWDGERLTLHERRDDSAATILVNGKLIGDDIELIAGDEIAVGPATLVVGTTATTSQAGRKPLAHQDFHARVAEEMARALRAGRPTSLAMVRALPGEGASIAQAALDSFRAGDVVGIYATDELEFLLPDAPGDTARAALTRLFARAGVTKVVAGVAVAPHDGDHVERLLRSARQALAHAERTSSNHIEGPPAQTPLMLGAPIALDPRTVHLLGELSAAASENQNVLLSGEASSGRGSYARQIHNESPRSTGPFVRLRANATVPDDELLRTFAHDAEAAMKQAEHGTLLIEELCELTLEAQTCLGVMLEEHPDLCVIGTTHRNLQTLIERQTFDEELWKRIAQALISIPPLRERPLDIVPMAERFAIEFGAVPPINFSPGALARLRGHAWPGNVLELRNVMERAVRLAGNGEIFAEYLPSDLPSAPASDGRLREHVDSIERDAIVKALSENHHNQTRAARKLGISRRALIYKMEKYGLKLPPSSTRKS